MNLGMTTDMMTRRSIDVKGKKMVKYIDDGVLLGWYFCREGCCWGDGTKKTAERIEKEMTEDGR